MGLSVPDPPTRGSRLSPCGVVYCDGIHKMPSSVAQWAMAFFCCMGPVVLREQDRRMYVMRAGGNIPLPAHRDLYQAQRKKNEPAWRDRYLFVANTPPTRLSQQQK